MHLIDLTDDKLFWKISVQKDTPNICDSLKKYCDNSSETMDNFEDEVMTELYTGGVEEIRKKKYLKGVILNDSCERCSKYITPLNSVFMLCLDCSKDLYESVSEKRAYELIGFREMRDRKNNVKEEKEGLAYIDLFVNHI